MLRQDPIRRKRGEMNLKRRLVSLPPVATTTALVPVANAPVAERSEHERKLDDYRIPSLFSMLLSPSRGSELVKLVENDLKLARQSGDELYTAVFEGVLAATRPEPDLSEAVRRYHQAFDLAEASDAPVDGVLHSVAWCLFSGSATSAATNAEVAELLDRARFEPNVSDESDDHDRRREIVREFRRQPSFASVFEAFRVSEENRLRRLYRLLVRPSRLTDRFPLLLFSKRRTPESKDHFLRNTVRQSDFCNAFLFSGGRGTVIDPNESFPDEFYRLGGSMRDLSNIVLTANSRITAETLSEFADLFETYYRAATQDGSDVPRLRFYVAPEIAECHKPFFQDMERRKITESVTELHDVSGTELPGGDLLFVRKGILHVKIRVQSEWRSVRLLTPMAGFEIAELPTVTSDVSVFAVRTQDDLFLAADLARRDGNGLTLFDVPAELRGFENPLREFLGSKIPMAPVGEHLVCDLRNRRFLDAVQSFHAEDETGWTGFDRISYSFDAEENEFVYFAKNEDARFLEDRTAILEMLRYNRQRRRGLYFSK